MWRRWAARGSRASRAAAGRRSDPARWYGFGTASPRDGRRARRTPRVIAARGGDRRPAPTPQRPSRAVTRRHARPARAASSLVRRIGRFERLDDREERRDARVALEGREAIDEVGVVRHVGRFVARQQLVSAAAATEARARRAAGKERGRLVATPKGSKRLRLPLGHPSRLPKGLRLPSVSVANSIDGYAGAQIPPSRDAEGRTRRRKQSAPRSPRSGLARSSSPRRIGSGSDAPHYSKPPPLDSTPRTVVDHAASQEAAPRSVIDRVEMPSLERGAVARPPASRASRRPEVRSLGRSRAARSGPVLRAPGARSPLS